MGDASDSEPVMVKSDGFFSKANMHTAGWAILFGAAGYVFSFVDPYGGEPQEVIVKNIDSLPRADSAAPTIVALDSESKADLARLRDVLAATELALSSAKSENRARVSSGTSLSQNDDGVERELRETQRALREAIKLASPAKISGDAPVQRSSMETVSLLVPDAIDEQNLPAEKRGYTLQPPKGIKGIRCPSFNTASGRLRFSFDVDKNVIENASFFQITVARIEAPLKQTQVFGEFFRASSGSNEVELEFSAPPGSYDVTLGYYDRRKLSGEFPPFYGISCNVHVPAISEPKGAE